MTPSDRSRRPPLHRSIGFYNGNIGPWLYLERGGFMLHCYFRWFRDEWDRELRAGLALRVRDRYRIFKTKTLAKGSVKA